MQQRLEAVRSRDQGPGTPQRGGGATTASEAVQRKLRGTSFAEGERMLQFRVMPSYDQPAPRTPDEPGLSHRTPGVDDELADAGGAGESEGAESAATGLRAEFPNGFPACLTVPEGWATPEQALLDLQADPTHFDPYAFRVHLPSFCDANPQQVDAWLGDSAPVRYADADGEQRESLRALLWQEHKSAVREAMAADGAFGPDVADTGYGNNAYIPAEAHEFAAEVRAVAGDKGAIERDRAMEYRNASDIAEHVNATARLVREEIGAADDDDAGKVSLLSISAHGTRPWMGGHGEAASASFGTGEVEGIVSSMASNLTGDVRVRLFACSTAAREVTEEDGERVVAPDAEGSMADTWRDELEDQGKEGGMVVGHHESGDSTRNTATRYFATGSREGDPESEDWHADQDESGWRNWDYEDVYGADFIRAEYDRLVAPNLDDFSRPEDSEVPADEWRSALRRGLRKVMGGFLSRYGWTMDLSSTEAYRAEARQRWSDAHPDVASVREDVLHEAD